MKNPLIECLIKVFFLWSGGRSGADFEKSRHVMAARGAKMQQKIIKL